MECAGTMRRGPRFRGWEGSSDCSRYWKIRQDAIAERGPSKLRVGKQAPPYNDQGHVYGSQPMFVPALP
jgi:hypothetical protein